MQNRLGRMRVECRTTEVDQEGKVTIKWNRESSEGRRKNGDAIEWTYHIPTEVRTKRCIVY